MRRQIEMKTNSPHSHFARVSQMLTVCLRSRCALSISLSRIVLARSSCGSLALRSLTSCGLAFRLLVIDYDNILKVCMCV